MLKLSPLVLLVMAGQAAAQTAICDPTPWGGVRCRQSGGVDASIPLQSQMQQGDALQGYQRGLEMRLQREAMEQNQRESYARQQESDARQQQAMADATRQQEAQNQARKAQETRRNVGQLLAYKECDKAIALALESGEIELATTARKFCEGDKTAAAGVRDARR